MSRERRAGGESRASARKPVPKGAGRAATRDGELARIDGGETAVEVEALAGAYHVTLPTFEGPLDLLLHLIQQHQLDVVDIPIGFITEKYVEYILLMQELNIDLASEYLVMAATLAHIKSKMLLPTPPADQEDDAAEDLDPRSELVRRLLEYQKYKQAAEELGKAPVLGRDVFLRGAPAPSVDGPAPLAPISVFKLFDAFQKLLSRVKQTAEHHIDVDRISISERILQLTDMLKGKGPVPFEKLFGDETTRADLIVTFLALLEMTRLRMMQVIQDGPLAPIQVELTLTDEHEDILKDAGGEDPLALLQRGDVKHTARADGEAGEGFDEEEARAALTGRTVRRRKTADEDEDLDDISFDEFKDEADAEGAGSEDAGSEDARDSTDEDDAAGESFEPTEEDVNSSEPAADSSDDEEGSERPE